MKLLVLALPFFSGPEPAPAAVLGAHSGGVSHPASSWIDVDSDGREDLLVLGEDGRFQLFRNLGSGELELIPDAFDAVGGYAFRHGSWGDSDGDGHVDLLSVTADGSVCLLRNLTRGAFEDATEAAGLTSTGVTAAHWNDVDADGRQDVVLVAGGRVELFRNYGQLVFEKSIVEGAPLLRPATGVALAGTEAGDAPSAASAGATPNLETARGSRRPVAPGAVVGDDVGSGEELVELPSGYDHEFEKSGASVKPHGTFCATALEDGVTGLCVGVSSTPMLGSLYPLGEEFSISLDGKVGFGTTSPQGRVSIGEYQGGTAGSASGQNRQLILGGEYNLGFNRTGTKLLISDYDNEAGTDMYPIYVEDENNVVDFYVHKLGLATSSYFNGKMGIGTAPSTKYTLTAKSADNTVIRATNESTTSAASSVVGVTLGTGSGVEGYAIGGTGVEGVSGTSTGYGVLATNSAGIGARIEGGNVLAPALEAVATGGSTIAGTFEGNLHVGLRGGPPFNTVISRVALNINGNEAGEIRLKDSNLLETVVITSEEFAASGGAQIQLFDNEGNATITLDADHSGAGRVITEIMEITGGADLVESFLADAELEPGTVVSIDPMGTGALTMSSTAYDSKVAGIVSGAGGVRPGLHLGQRGVVEGDTPVALSGRVYVKATAANGPIRPGDMLTTAELAGHAMRADDPARAFGSVIGKALSSLDAETGLVFVLVNLQ